MEDKLNSNKKLHKARILFVVSILLLIVNIGITIYNSKSKVEFKSSSNAKVYKMYMQDDTGEYKISTSRDFPTTGYTLNTTKSTCTNGAKVSQALDKTILLNTTEGTKCTLYFDKALSAVKYIQNLVSDASSTSTDVINKGTIGTDNACTNTLAYDGTNDNNLRYVGSNPCNYVKFNDELWRIVGIFNNIDNGEGTKEARVKLIRAEGLGNYSWDTSANTVNNGYGVNEWSDSDLQKELNTDYLGNTTIGTDGNWYNGLNNGKTGAMPTSVLNAKALGMIDNAIWNLGSINASNNDENAGTTLTSNLMYTRERGTLSSKQCTDGNYCNDNVTRNTVWTGKVALMYASDYGFATSGGTTTTRSACLSRELPTWNDASVSDCMNNDWLLKSSWQWTLSARAYSNYANRVFAVSNAGYVLNVVVGYAGSVSPVVYLKASNPITGGVGSSSNPYTLE